MNILRSFMSRPSVALPVASSSPAAISDVTAAMPSSIQPSDMLAAASDTHDAASDPNSLAVPCLTDVLIPSIALKLDCIDCSASCAHPQLPKLLAQKIDWETSLSTTFKQYSRQILVSTARNTSSIWPEQIETLPQSSIVTYIKEAVSAVTMPTTTESQVASAAIVSTDTSTATNDTSTATTDAPTARPTPKIILTLIDKAPGSDEWLPSIKSERPDPSFLNNMQSTELIIMPDMIRMTISLNDPPSKLSDILNLPVIAGQFNCNEPIINGELEYGTRLKSIILVCAHKKRDKRCAVAAEILLAEFELQIKALGMQDEIGVYGCSHIGGHKFAGNVIIYPQGDWYGRVGVCHVKVLLEEAVLKQSVIRDLWRGRVSLNANERCAIDLDW